MSYRGVVAVLTGVLLAAMLAPASTKENIRIKVLDSETRSLTVDNSGVPKNCDDVNFDAYCHNSKSAQLINTLLVQEGDQPPFRITCTVDTKWSRCMPLPRGESFDAKVEKRGLVVYYVDDKGKARGQLYTLVDSNGKTGPRVSVAAAATHPITATAAPRQGSPAPAPAPSVGPVQPAVPKTMEKVKCNFSSTPPGADITVDGKYVGSTPSEIPLSIGAHVVILSMPGFAEWKRELTVEADSIVNVTASLQKTQP